MASPPRTRNSRGVRFESGSAACLGSRHGAPANGPPLACKDAVYDLVGPLALDELVLDEMRLTAHAEALQYRRRGRVTGVEAPTHAMRAELVERNIDHCARGLRRIPDAAVRGQEHVADLRLAVLLADPPDADLAGDDRVRRELHRQVHPQTLAFDLRTHAGERDPRLLSTVRASVQVARHLRVAE